MKMKHYLALKAQTAKQKSDALHRASNADALAKELHDTRCRMRTLRKELNETKLQLHIQFEESRGNESETHSSSDDEAADALTKVRSMPTWRAVRRAKYTASCQAGVGNQACHIRTSRNDGSRLCHRDGNCCCREANSAVVEPHRPHM